MPKRREVCSIYNEVKRFYLFRRRRWADTLFDTLYHVIFILGFYSLLRGNSDFQLSYFYYYFILTHVVSLGNEELEYEIRSGQSFGTQYALQSVYRIYLQRAVVYFVWLSLIFWIALLLIHQGLPTHFSLKVISFQGLFVVLIGFLIFLGYYLVMIRLTIRFQRISVLVDFLNTVLLFYSGLVFPVVSFGNLKKLFDGIIRN